tara:strand:+ start:365 stop:604 length:240 start_codon:yes stop_codon:yes gene_type:complete
MPQIGWFELLIIVIIAILVIGPKDFPIMLKKMGTWVGSFKNYFNELQQNFKEVESDIEEEIFIKEDSSKQAEKKKKDEE